MNIYNKKLDILNFIIIPIIAILGLYSVALFSNFDLLMLFVVYTSIEFFHVFFTLPLLKYNKKLILIYLVVFLTLFSMLYFQIPYFWNIISYYTFYHVFKQNYGLLVIYSKKCKSHFGEKYVDYFFYTLIALPFIMYHFHPDASSNINLFSQFHGNNIFLEYPNIYIYNVLKTIYCLNLFYWIYLEYKNYNKNEHFRLLMFSLIFSINLVSFISPYFLLALIPIHTIYHVISYYFLTKKYYNSLEIYKKHIFNKRNLIILFVVILAIEYFSVLTLLSGKNYLDSPLSLSSILIISAYFCPVISHYIIDGMLWKSNSKYFKDIFYKES